MRLSCLRLLIQYFILTVFQFSLTVQTNKDNFCTLWKFTNDHIKFSTCCHAEVFHKSFIFQTNYIGKTKFFSHVTFSFYLKKQIIHFLHNTLNLVIWLCRFLKLECFFLFLCLLCGDNLTHFSPRFHPSTTQT